MLYYILIFCSFLQSVIGFTLMSSSVMCFREPVKRRIVIGLMAMLAGICFLSYTLFTKGINSVDDYAILVILIIQLSWYLSCSKDHFFVSFVSFLTFVNVYISISYISDSLSVHWEGAGFVLERILFRTLIYLILLPFLFKFVRPRFRRLVDTLDREWRFTALVPLMFLILQMMVLYYPTPYWNWNDNNWYQNIVVTIYLLFLAVYYLIYIQANAIVEKYALEKRQLLMTQQEKLWEAELARQKATADLTIQQRHDMHHHNAVILDMLKNDDRDNLQAYMKRFDAALDVHKSTIFCSHPIANSLFNVYAKRGEEEGVEMTFRVSIPSAIGIDNIDLTCVLGNALENGIEGCLRVNGDVKKEMSVLVKFLDNRLRIHIENTCVEEILFNGEMPLTQKDGGGTGTKSILYTAERYDGTAGFSVSDGKFITQIVLNAR